LTIKFNENYESNVAKEKTSTLAALSVALSEPLWKFDQAALLNTSRSFLNNNSGHLASLKVSDLEGKDQIDISTSA
jgi:hypothetical protein